MENYCDFLDWLGPDASTAVLSLLDDPADLVRVSAVSRSWRRFVIANGFGKNLCLRISPEVSNIVQIAEVSSASKTRELGSSAAVEWESMEREHRVYLYLCHCLYSHKGRRNCIYQAICASSTDNYPDESIENTLEPSEIVDRSPSYWSSRGQRDPGVPESLTCRLVSNLCVVDEIKIRPFKAFFQYGRPIYSAKSVRFQMGYCRLAQAKGTCTENGYAEHHAAPDDFCSWTYTSPEFPMLQVIVCHVQVIGRPLSPVLDLDTLESAGSLVLKYFPDARSSTVPEGTEEDEAGESSSWHSFAVRLGHLRDVRRWNEAILSSLLGPIQFSDDEEDDGDGDGDGDDVEEEHAL